MLLSVWGGLVVAGGSGNPTFAVTAGSLPPGLSLDPDSGEISGTPTAKGTFTFTVTATDPNPNVPAASRQFTLTVQSPARHHRQRPPSTADPARTPTTVGLASNSASAPGGYGLRIGRLMAVNFMDAGV
ncbi:Ig domain-containing protein [Streptomyces mirabilis]|uniref:Ig domain-containing protein n=1 Tax=Streptomyces mirabilis TaxID=68239 RepID=UPI00369B2C06